MKKKTFMIFALCFIIGGLSIFGTFALLSAFTDPITNSFSSTDAKNLSIVLTEDKFDQAKANAYVPGDIIEKNPTIQNTSKEESVYAAIKVTFQIIEGNDERDVKQSEFNALASIGVLGKGWRLVEEDNLSGAQLYIYEQELKAGDTINPELFQDVVVNKEIAFKKDGSLPSFNIKVEGLATQYKNVALDEAKAALIQLFQQSI